MQKDALAKRLAERKKRVAAKKGINGSGGSFISSISSPSIIPKNREFEPVLKNLEDEGEPRVEECKSSDEDELIKVTEVKLSPSRPGEKNYAETNINEISAINNTTIGHDTSMNNSQFDLIRKLHSTAVGD